MVIVNPNVCVVSVLLLALIVLGSELCINNGRCLVIDVEGEAVCIGGITLLAIPVKLRGHNDLELYIVVGNNVTGLIIRCRQVERRAVRSRASVIMRLGTVVIGLTPYNLTRSGINDLNI